jgi:cob(I)alamin adenosyltransferase
MKYKNITKGRGDGGKTDLLFGERVSKTDERIVANGVFDKFNAQLGLCRHYLIDSQETLEIISSIQKNLVSIMGYISSPEENKALYEMNFPTIKISDLEFLNQIKDRLAESLDEKTGGQKGWVVYGSKGRVSAYLDMAGVVCREAELSLCFLQERGFQITDAMKAYMNRLSKVLYLLARTNESQD